MNVNLLIDAIVRQTTVFIAQLATASGTRTPLAHMANQVFSDLVRQLKEQGLGNKVIADMFGLSLRTYQNKIARLSESGTDRGRSLWEALLAHVTEAGSASKAEVLERFRNDDEVTVRGVLKDLVGSGLLFQTGRGDSTMYRVATVEDAVRYRRRKEDAEDAVAAFVWIAIYRYAPLTRKALVEHVPAGNDELDAALAFLIREGRVSEDLDAPAPRAPLRDAGSGQRYGRSVRRRHLRGHRERDQLAPRLQCGCGLRWTQ